MDGVGLMHSERIDGFFDSLDDQAKKKNVQMIPNKDAIRDARVSVDPIPIPKKETAVKIKRKRGRPKKKAK